MAEYIDCEQAIGMSGLRLVLTPGLPAPWSESAKCILHVKQIPYTRVRQEILGANVALLRWTAQATAPVAAWNDEPPRSTWIEQLYLFERLAPQPRLIPADWDERVLMIGLAHEICGENGLTWNRRHIMVRDYTSPERDEKTRETFGKLGRKYWYSPEAGAQAPQRCAEIMQKLAARLEQQRAKGSRYFIGNSLTTLDIYWACHAVTMQPPPQEVCPMPPSFREVYSMTDPVLKSAASPILFEHRDFIYKQHQLPFDF